jgi:hypothetical protein
MSHRGNPSRLPCGALRAALTGPGRDGQEDLSRGNGWLSTHVRNYGDVLLSGSRSQLFGGKLGYEGMKIVTREGPFEGRCSPFIVSLEGKCQRRLKIPQFPPVENSPVSAG